MYMWCCNGCIPCTGGVMGVFHYSGVVMGIFHVYPWKYQTNFITLLTRGVQRTPALSNFSFIMQKLLSNYTLI